MSSGGSFTKLISPFKDGDEQALEMLRQRCWPILVNLAHKKLGGGRRAEMEDEDVAQEAFWGFYRSFKAGKVPRLENRQHLFAVLTLITARKAANRFPRGKNAKQVRVQGESELKFLAGGGESSSLDGLAQIVDSAFGPAEQASLKDLLSRFFDALPDDLRDIAERWYAGCANRDIAAATGWSVQTIRQKIKERILPKWQQVFADSVNSDE